LQTIDFPGSTSTQAFGLNDHGQVVGAYVDAAGAMHGFLLSKGQFQSIDDPFGVGTTLVNGINDFGALVGFYMDAAGNTDGFLAIPGGNIGFTSGATLTGTVANPSVVDGLINVGAVSQATEAMSITQLGSGDTDAEHLRPANAANILASAAAAALNPDFVDALFATTPDQTGHHNGHHRGN
jgi:hypothetical protein